MAEEAMGSCGGKRLTGAEAGGELDGCGRRSCGVGMVASAGRSFDNGASIALFGHRAGARDAKSGLVQRVCDSFPRPANIATTLTSTSPCAPPLHLPTLPHIQYRHNGRRRRKDAWPVRFPRADTPARATSLPPELRPPARRQPRPRAPVLIQSSSCRYMGWWGSLGMQSSSPR